MFQGDFAWLNFDNEFDRPNEEATRSFVIDDEPVAASRSGSNRSAEGFLLIQARDVDIGSAEAGEETAHQILVNGKHLPSFDMITGQGWNLWMDRIPEGFLKKGENRLTIRRKGPPFRVANVVVQWREKVSAGVTLPDPVLVPAQG